MEQALRAHDVGRVGPIGTRERRSLNTIGCFNSKMARGGYTDARFLPPISLAELDDPL